MRILRCLACTPIRRAPAPIAGVLLALATAAACSNGTEETTETSMPTGATINPSTTANDSATSEGPTTNSSVTNSTTNSSNTTNTTNSTTTTDPGTTSGATETDPTIDPSESATDTSGTTTGVPPELDTQCLVVHKSGDPATLQTVRVDPDGALTDTGYTLELSGGHSPASTDYRREGLVSCGDRFVYAAMLDDDKVAAIDVGYYGELSVINEVNVPNVEGLLCDREDELVFAFGRNAGKAHLRSFGINADGTLDPVANVDLNYTYTGAMQLYSVLHPKLRVLYLAGKTEGGDVDVEIHKVNYSDSGALVPDNLTSVSGTLLFGVDVSPSGDELAIVSWNGQFAWHNLPATGQVPASGNLNIINATEWQNGVDIEIRTDPSSDEHFYYAKTTGTLGEIRVGEFLGDQLMYYATETGAGKRMHLHLAWDDTVLVAVAQTGAMKSWSIDSEGTGLTLVGDMSVGGTAVQASDLVSCAAQ